MPRPDWTPFEAAFNAFDQMGAVAGSDEVPWLIGVLDQNFARIRDDFDELGVSVTDETQLHTILAALDVFMGLVREMSGTHPALLEFAHAAALGFSAQLLHFAPDDARPR